MLVPTAVRNSSVGVRTEAASPYLSWSDLDVEVAPLVGDLEYFRPCKAVDPQAVSVDEQTVCTDTQHDVNPLRVLPPGCKAETHSLRQGSNTTWALFWGMGGGSLLLLPWRDAGPLRTLRASWHFLKSSPLLLLDSSPYDRQNSSLLSVDSTDLQFSLTQGVPKM